METRNQYRNWLKESKRKLASSKPNYLIKEKHLLSNEDKQFSKEYDEIVSIAPNEKITSEKPLSAPMQLVSAIYKYRTVDWNFVLSKNLIIIADELANLYWISAWNHFGFPEHFYGQDLVMEIFCKQNVKFISAFWRSFSTILNRNRKLVSIGRPRRNCFASIIIETKKVVDFHKQKIKSSLTDVNS